MNTPRNVIVGTAGHIDHGKSALVEALTGTHPDRLEEEKRRGITIDLGFAFLQLEDVCLGFVDVPGHERFVRNMLAGAGGVDLLLLVIAADESIKPQTREHFEICRLLGISRGVVALTKTDLVESEVAELARLEVEDLVHGSFLQGAPIVPVSARTGAGLEHLKAELLRAARDIPERDAHCYFRLPVDRAFALKGFGTVVTGTLISGSIAPENEAELFPARRRVRIRGVHSAGQAVTRAFAGQRTALNLAGIDLADVRRGMTLAAPGHFRTTQRFDARLNLLPGARPLKNHARVHFHQGTAELIAGVVLLEKHEDENAGVLAPGGSAFVQLRLDDPLLLLPGDRFIIRQFSPVTTIGGGIVLDALARRHRRGDLRVLSFLRTLESSEILDVLLAHIESRPMGMELSQLVARTGWTEAVVRAAARELCHQEKILIVSEQPFMIVSAATFANVTQALEREVDAFHRANPLAPGISREELRGILRRSARPEVFRACLETLVQSGKLTLSGDLVSLAGHTIALLPEELRARELIIAEFERAGLAVPTVDEVLAKLSVERKHAMKLVQILLREKVLLKVTESLFFHQAALARLRELLAVYRREHGERISVTAFKDLTGVTRKYAIPLLEYLDRERLTRRQGDERVIL